MKIKQNKIRDLLLFSTWVLSFVSIASPTGGIITAPGASEGKHFDQKDKFPKLPSKFTIELQKNVRAELPFDDKRDAEEAKRGFIAAPDFKQIKNDQNDVIWDMSRYDFLLQGKNFDSINPSLQRQAILNMAYGLYEVVPGKIYQVRGFDLANFTVVKSNTGWIIIDPLTVKETASAALAFVNATLGERPVVAVIYSHSHSDHYGGAHGVISEADVISGKVQVIAPEGFVENAISENVYAGNAMTRRTIFQFGRLLPRTPFGYVDQSIGKDTALGGRGLIPPNVHIKEPFETLTVDGVTMEFQNTPGTEAPAEMNTWFPQYKAFWAAENITGTIHNIYTLRGALVRDSLVWSKSINTALYRYGLQAETLFSAHNWPRWDNKRIQEVMRTQRDVYANLNNEVLHQANMGVTINEIQNIYRLPESLKNNWSAHSYHGSEEHNSRAVINRYLGYWDANPATLIPLSPKDSAPLYVKMMGGASKIISKAKSLNNKGNYLYSIEILNKLVYAEPQNRKAKELLADAFEQVGYQKESTSLRNSFLAAAYELRNGMQPGVYPKPNGPDTVRAISTEQWLNFLGIRLVGSKAAGMAFTINLKTPDNREEFVIELSNSTLTNIKGQQASDPDLSITVNRSDLQTVMGETATFDELINSGKAKLDGDRKPLDQLNGLLTSFTPDFEIMPGTKADDRTKK